MFVRLTFQHEAAHVPAGSLEFRLVLFRYHAALPAGAGLMQLVLVVYLTESAKYASSAVTMFRRSDFIEEMYAFSFVLANFCIATLHSALPITTTINSSMSVKPLRFMQPPAQTVCLWAKTCRDRFEQGLCRRWAPRP